MTVTETLPATTSPVTFRRTILVGIDDPGLDSIPPVPALPAAAPLTVEDVLAQAAPAAVDGDASRARLVAACASVALLIVIVAAMAWFRFSSAPHMEGVSGPTPDVMISVPSDYNLSSGAPVTVDIGPGAPPERLDLFIDGDWVGEDHEAPYTPEWEHRSAGTHELKAKVTDVDGRVRYSDPVRVTITD